MRALLDVNVLIAMIDEYHPHHNLAQHWAKEHRDGFATCPIVQNGVLRIMANPVYNSADGTDAFSYPSLFEVLQNSLKQVNHEFWADNISLLSAQHFNHDTIHSHKQLTDIYLLALAVAHEGCLVTFDRGIALSHAVGASKRHLIVLK
jgi:uncharacterized protein